MNRHNPMLFDLQYTPEDAERYRTSRAVRSLLSSALQQRNVERMADTPHNFVVVIRGFEASRTSKPLPVFSDALTLGVAAPDIKQVEDFYGSGDKAMAESIYTAFTYLHKLGDALVPMLFGDEGDRLLLHPEKRSQKAAHRAFYEMVDEHLGLLKAWADTEDAYLDYLDMLGASVNSKMVRDGYSAGWDQSVADLFPLCELTPWHRPLLLPVSENKFALAEVFNYDILPDFNITFRAFYNDLIPSMYGTSLWLTT